METDLRKHVLARRRWLISGLTVLAVVAAYIWSIYQPEMYRATAGVGLCRLRPETIFAADFEAIGAAEEITGRTQSGHAKGLATLVRNNALAQAVINRLDESLDMKERDAVALMGMIEDEVEGDVIRISVSNTDREKAALIANTWAVEYERHVNNIYSSGIGRELVDSMNVEAKRSKQRYEAAEKALTDFLGRNSLELTERVLQEKKDILRDLEQVKRQRLDTATGEITDCYAERRRLRRLLGNAKALKQQIWEDGGASTGTALALLLLEKKVYVREDEEGADKDQQEEGRLQLDLSSLAESGQMKQRKEIGALVQVVEKRLVELDAVIAEAFTGPPPPEAGVVARSAKETWLERALSQKGMEDIESAMKKIEGEIAKLEGKVAPGRAREKELARARDQAWETYKTLAKKVEELSVVGQIKGREVKLVSKAAVPQNPVSPRTGRNVGLAAAAGFVFSCFLAFFVEFVGTIAKQ